MSWIEPVVFGDCVKKMPEGMAMVGVLVDGATHLRGCRCFEQDDDGPLTDLAAEDEP